VTVDDGLIKRDPMAEERGRGNTQGRDDTLQEGETRPGSQGGSHDGGQEEEDHRGLEDILGWEASNAEGFRGQPDGLTGGAAGGGMTAVETVEVSALLIYYLHN